eukprot:COSAG01_NODE_13347_length_1597_cov_8.715621_1_plen_73_part_00
MSCCKSVKAALSIVPRIQGYHAEVLLVRAKVMPAVEQSCLRDSWVEAQWSVDGSVAWVRVKSLARESKVAFW